MITFTRIIRYAKQKVFWYWMVARMKVAYYTSQEFRSAHQSMVDIIAKPHTENINLTDHIRISKKVIRNLNLQKEVKIGDLYTPGVEWQYIIENKPILSHWKITNSSEILQNALFRFHRTDLVLECADEYIWNLKSGLLDLKLQTWMMIYRYREYFVNRRISTQCVPITLISANDIGQNTYVKYRGYNLTFQIMRFANVLNRIIEKGLFPDNTGVIGELGTGTGGLPILAKKVFPGCTYVCFDLPETLILASYNIMMQFPNARVALYEDLKDTEIITRDILKEYDFVLLPNWMIENIAGKSIDLFINYSSMSEMNRPQIANYLKHIERITTRVFYTSNRNVRDVVVHDYMEVPIDEWEFPDSVKLVSKVYDKGADEFHPRYGMGYRGNYWEYVFAFQ